MTSLLASASTERATVFASMAARLSLYESVANTLMERITSGSIAVGQPLPSERELCLEFNVSRQTVRNALAQLSTRGVLDSRAGAGHFVRLPGESGRPKPADGARKRSTRQIGLICPPKLYLEEPSQWRTLMGIKSRISREGYSLVMSVTQKDEKLGFYPSYQHWLEDGEVEGYIAISATAAIQRRLFDSGYPAMSMGYVWEDLPLPSIAVDFRKLYAEILHHIAGLGHTRVAATVIVPDSAFTRNVEAGLGDGVAALGWEEDAVIVRRFSDTAYDLVSSIRAIIRSPQRPGALILQGDNFLDEVMRFFEIEGIRIPEDLYVIAVQVDNPVAREYGNRVAYYDFDYLAIGRLVAQRMLEIIAGKTLEPLHQEILLGKIVDASAAVK